MKMLWKKNDEKSLHLCKHRQKPAEKPTNKYEHITLLNGYECIE